MTEIECTECKATGYVETIGGYERPCDACSGTGWREPTQGEQIRMLVASVKDTPHD